MYLISVLVCCSIRLIYISHTCPCMSPENYFSHFGLLLHLSPNYSYFVGHPYVQNAPHFWLNWPAYPPYSYFFPIKWLGPVCTMYSVRYACVDVYVYK